MAIPYESKSGNRKEKQYDFYLTVYFLRMAFCKVSTASVYKEGKSLVKSEKVTTVPLKMGIGL